MRSVIGSPRLISASVSSVFFFCLHLHYTAKFCCHHELDRCLELPVVPNSLIFKVSWFRQYLFIRSRYSQQSYNTCSAVCSLNPREHSGVGVTWILCMYFIKSAVSCYEAKNYALFIPVKCNRHHLPTTGLLSYSGTLFFSKYEVWLSACSHSLPCFGNYIMSLNFQVHLLS